MTAATLLDRLDGIRRTKPGSWVARCPAHDDRGPSLSIRETDDGRVLVHCFAGCDTESVLDAVGLTFSDLYPERLHHHRAPTRPRADYRALWLVVRRAFYLLLVATEDISAGRPLSIDDQRKVQAARRRIEQAARVLDGEV